MRRTDSMEETLMLGKIEGWRRRGQQIGWMELQVGWYHWLNGHEFEQAPGVGNTQGSLVCCSPWCLKESETSERLNWTYLKGKDHALLMFIFLKQISGNIELDIFVEFKFCSLMRTYAEMAGWHHWLYGHEFGWTLGVGDGQGGLACCDSWGRKESDTTERLNWTEPCKKKNLNLVFWGWEEAKKEFFLIMTVFSCCC